MRYAPYSFVFAAALLSACGGSGSGSGNNDANVKTNAELQKLSDKVDALGVKLSALQTRQGLAFIESLKGPQESVEFDPQDEQKYQSVKAPAGPVLVILEKVEPYLDGFTVYVRFGNPSSAGYSGVKGKVSWGRQFDPAKDNDHNKLAEKEIDLNDTLGAGSWTLVKFKIAPAKAEDVRRIVIAPVFNAVLLRMAGR